MPSAPGAPDLEGTGFAAAPFLAPFRRHNAEQKIAHPPGGMPRSPDFRGGRPDLKWHAGHASGLCKRWHLPMRARLGRQQWPQDLQRLKHIRLRPARAVSHPLAPASPRDSPGLSPQMPSKVGVTRRKHTLCFRKDDGKSGTALLVESSRLASSSHSAQRQRCTLPPCRKPNDALSTAQITHVDAWVVEITATHEKSVRCWKSGYLGWRGCWG